MKLSAEEWRLIVSALEYDTLGTWGDGRGEAIKSLITKIKKGKVNA